MANFTIPNNATSMVDMLQKVDTMVSGAFGTLIMLSIFMVVFLASKDYGTKRSLTVAFFVTTVSGYLLSVVGIVSGYLIALPMLGLAWSVLFLE